METMEWLPIVGVAVSAVFCIGVGLVVALLFFDTPSTDPDWQQGGKSTDA